MSIYDEFEKTTERHRYCDSCQSNVMNLDGLSEGQIEGACLGNPAICIHATLPHPAIEVKDAESKARCPDVRSEYRLIHTARHLSAMNVAVDSVHSKSKHVAHYFIYFSYIHNIWNTLLLILRWRQFHFIVQFVQHEILFLCKNIVDAQLDLIYLCFHYNKG